MRCDVLCLIQVSGDLAMPHWRCNRPLISCQWCCRISLLLVCAVLCSGFYAGAWLVNRSWDDVGKGGPAWLHEILISGLTWVPLLLFPVGIFWACFPSFQVSFCCFLRSLLFIYADVSSFAESISIIVDLHYLAGSFVSPPYHDSPPCHFLERIDF